MLISKRRTPKEKFSEIWRKNIKRLLERGEFYWEENFQSTEFQKESILKDAEEFAEEKVL